MVLLPHLTYPKARLANGLGLDNRLTGTAPREDAIQEMTIHSSLVTGLMAHVTKVDPNLEFESTRALLDLLSWLTKTVFPNALARYCSSIQKGPIWIQAQEAVDTLGNCIQDAANRPEEMYEPDTSGEAPVESALELIYTSILEGVKPVNFVQAWQEIKKLKIIKKLNVHGMPDVGMLCWGPTSPVSHFVVTTNVPRWKGFSVLGTWARKARKETLPDDYVREVEVASNVLVNKGGFNKKKKVADEYDLRKAWQRGMNARPRKPDAELLATWNTIWKDHAPADRSTPSFNRTGIREALAFDIKSNVVPRERCVRCRVLFRFEMSRLEPLIYGGKRGGPFPNRLSCAEVAAYDKCTRYGL